MRISSSVGRALAAGSCAALLVGCVVAPVDGAYAPGYGYPAVQTGEAPWLAPGVPPYGTYGTYGYTDYPGYAFGGGAAFYGSSFHGPRFYGPRYYGAPRFVGRSPFYPHPPHAGGQLPHGSSHWHAGAGHPGGPSAAAPPGGRQGFGRPGGGAGRGGGGHGGHGGR